MRTRKMGFTLIEMLVVIAITAVLLTIIVLPVFQSFNLTRAAEAFADAQDQGRRLTEKIAREISNSVSVRGSSALVQITINDTGTGSVAVKVPAHALIVQVPGATGATEDVVLDWAKIDIVNASQGTPSGTPGVYINPITGMIDPTLKSPKGQVNAPVVAGPTWIRYSIGLRNVALPYSDPYTGVLMQQGGGKDNLTVLYRSEALPTIVTATGPKLNTALFAIDPNTGQPMYDDPRFLVLVPNATQQADIQHNYRVYHWLGQMAPGEPNTDPIADNPLYFAHTTIQTEFTRYDMVQAQVTGTPAKAVYDPSGAPRLTPLVQFKPTVISNDPAAGQEALRPGEETDNAAAIAPDVYKTQYALWNNAIVRTFPSGYLSSVINSGSTTPFYVVGYNSASNNAPGFSEYAYNPASGQGEFTGGTEMFDDYTYNLDVTNGYPYPFTDACKAANGRSSWLTNPNALAVFTPYNILSGTGKIVASFDISEVGINQLTAPATYPNLPTYQVSTATVPASVTQDNGAGASYSALDTSTYDINRAFNLAWNSFPDLQQSLQRFIDLRVIPNEDGTFGPLYPGQIGNTVTGFQVPALGTMLSRCRIVPGSETVYGPDQNPGPNYGHRIRYTRTTQSPGPDQYKINYVDQQEPALLNGNVEQVSANSYETLLQLTAAEVGNFNPATYDPTNFTSAYLQPRYKAGYIQLNSDPNVPIPNGYYGPITATGSPLTAVPFQVDYRFQFTGTLPSQYLQAGAGSTDVFAVDYDSRQLMQVLLTVRNYAQSNLPNPESITLKTTASIRNYIR